MSSPTNANGSVTVNHNGGTATDGIDTLWNIERLTFTDQSVELAGTNIAATGTAGHQRQLADRGPDTHGEHGGHRRRRRSRRLHDHVAGGSSTSAPGCRRTWDRRSPRRTVVVGLPLRAVVNFIDGSKARPEQVTGAATQPVINVNDVPVRAPTISSNTPSVNVPLTVSHGSIADDDGKPPAFGIQWFRGNTPIPGANATTYVPSDDDIGQTLRVVVTYTDLHGTAETVSAATAAVINVNDPPTGLAINNLAPVVGDVLTASGPSDLDGTSTSVFQRRWQAGSGSTFTDIPGATGRRSPSPIRRSASSCESSSRTPTTWVPRRRLPRRPPPLWSRRRLCRRRLCRRRPPTRSAAARRPRRWRTSSSVCRRRSGRSTLATQRRWSRRGRSRRSMWTSAGVPADATAVSLNVTATGTTGAGFVTVYPV